MYGIDVDSEELAHRSWRWLRTRILGLLDRPPAVVPYRVGDAHKLALVPSTRVGYALSPPKFE